MRIGRLKDMNLRISERKFQVFASMQRITRSISNNESVDTNIASWTLKDQMIDTRHRGLIGRLRPQGVELHRQEVERRWEALLEFRLDNLHASRLEDLSEFRIGPRDTAILTVVHIFFGEMSGQVLFEDHQAVFSQCLATPHGRVNEL